MTRRFFSPTPPHEREVADAFDCRPPRGGDGPQARRGISSAILTLGLLLTPLPALAVNPDEVLKDPVLEERARNLSAQLRCMVCQNQSIDDSNAELAKDLRLLVRERIVDGDTDGEVIDYVVSRYGEFVLLKPRLSGRTLVLWAAPAFLLVIGAGTVLVMIRKRRTRRGPEQLLTPEEQARLDRLLEE
ncbi:cytochrome c-type biogenesis protein [Rhizobium sp. SSA_523]|uniref:cytochrome c-type biogenesis protein n=1 Tax=Rhizobium sp. SSA_523 TaxID=2952477 RepID=UPI00209045BB|nr:cytochrome c-type biogenesis protein [Rhizobium sp. SSA_523]MCO5730889.1 cytochrome c-type biogenesis protein CcmH [Rhizobium sp. SSA_523]WKC24295.1 cytochrome c-type biogenesis protein CcmH [Rhizobium sp. SSA_523]